MDAWWRNPASQSDLDSAPQKAFYREVINAAQANGASFDEKDVVDVGCGTGVLLQEILSRYAPRAVFGYDFSEQALKVCAARMPNAQFGAYDVYDPPPMCADVVFCTEVLEHLLYPDLALKNLLRMCRTGGMLIVTVPDGRKDTFLGHINFWSPESWRVFVESTAVGMHVDTRELSCGGLCAVFTHEPHAMSREDRRVAESIRQ
jgi:2-polyprenyl-3-methyl-5-hydroxy-6-metoxy-1,4-benzoquinol methylase